MKKSLLSKLLGAVCSLSMVSASLAVNSACLFFVYEPEMPEAAEALKKIK
ncbi:MAG: cyclic lactone autoinducer peptide [Lachnospiraceae bacterium]